MIGTTNAIRRSAAVGFLAWAVGCGGGPVPCVVTGEARVDGEPAGGVYVVFHAAGAGVGAPDIGSARTGDDGSFTAVVAEPGESVVTAFWPEAVVEGQDVVEGADRFKGAHQNPARPVATVTIHEGGNVMAPLLLNSPAAGRRRRGRR